jgi:hypothetical protein
LVFPDRINHVEKETVKKKKPPMPVSPKDILAFGIYT